jgi:acyl-lipid omega-3 desaturase
VNRLGVGVTSSFVETSNPKGLERERLPFTIHDVKNAIPKHCFESSVWRSMAYFFMDWGIVAGLVFAAATINAWWFFPIYWFAQGTMFWALFVVGHDCGHGSFSRSRSFNYLIGHICHSAILVPFHGWRISHRTHHHNTGSLENDESWYPLSKSDYESMDASAKFARFNLFLFAYPIYLFTRSPGKTGSHFSPNSPVFRPSERNMALTSTACCLAMVAFLVFVIAQFGFGTFFAYYFVPYWGFVVWLDLVTFLHHTDEEVPWYRGEDWYFLKGALSTVDRNYGIFESIHHNIGTHVAHHVFLTIPHYHLLEATEAIKPVLGEHYRKAKDPIWKALWKGYKNCHYVPDTGSKVYHIE